MKQVIHYKSQELNTAYQKIINQLVEILELDLTEISDLVKFKSIISILPELDFIIIFAIESKVLEIEQLEKILIDLNSDKNLIVIGNYFSSRAKTRVFNGVLDFEKIKSIINDIIIQNKIASEKNMLKEFVPIKFSFIEEFQKIPFPVDFYLRIKQSADDYQYLKKLLKNDLFTPEEIEKFRKFNLDFLYINREEYSDFLKFSVRLAFASNKQNQSLKNSDFSFHLAAKSLALVGINEENIKLVKQNISSMEESISKTSALAEYFQLINSNQLSYSYAHSYLISLFMSKVAQAFSWDSNAIKEKIVYVSFFHDISLPEEHLVRIHSHEELHKEQSVEYEFQAKSKIRESILSHEEIEKVNYHAVNSSLILDQFPQVPIGVSQVVREHHGAKNGIGFNDNMSISIQPLAMLFIVVEDFVACFLDIAKPTSDDIKNILKKLKDKYNKGNYKKAVESIEQYLFSLRS